MSDSSRTTYHIPQSLVEAVKTRGDAIPVEIHRHPSGEKTELRALPAAPGALNPLWIAPVSSPGNGPRLAEVDESVTRCCLPDGTIKIYDDSSGKAIRRQEVASRTPETGTPIVVIGTGSLGSDFSVMMARSGYRHQILIDGDTVESHNSTKSIAFTEEHTGWPKPLALGSVLRSIDPGANVIEHPRYFDAEFVEDCGESMLANDPGLVYVGADDIESIRRVVRWLDSVVASGRRAPFLLVQFVFVNARAGLALFWDPHSASMPCPACFFASNPDIYDRAMSSEEIDPLTYSATSASSSSPQIASDIAGIVAGAASYAIGLLTGSEERLGVIAERPWLYSFALRHAPIDIDWISPANAGGSYCYPEMPTGPFPGCPCCRSAERVAELEPAMPGESGAA